MTKTQLDHPTQVKVNPGQRQLPSQTSDKSQKVNAGSQTRSVALSERAAFYKFSLDDKIVGFCPKPSILRATFFPRTRRVLRTVSKHAIHARWLNPLSHQP